MKTLRQTLFQLLWAWRLLPRSIICGVTVDVRDGEPFFTLTDNDNVITRNWFKCATVFDTAAKAGTDVSVSTLTPKAL